MIMKISDNFRKGSAIAYALVIIAVVLILFTSIIQFIASQMKYSLYVSSRDEALRIAESGTDFYRWYLYHEIEGKAVQQIHDFWENGDPIAVGTPDCGNPGAYEVEYKDPGGAAIGKYCLEVTPPPAWATMVTVKSVGWTYKYPEVKRTVQVRLRRPAWSEYMVLGNEMFRLSSGTEVFGKMHSNTGVHFDGVAHNIVSNELETYYDNDSDVKAWKPGVWTSWPGEYNTVLDNDVFIAGKIYPDGHKDFNSVVGNFGLIKQAAVDGQGQYFDNTGGGRHIILKTNDTYDICTVDSYNPVFTITKYKQTDGSGTCNTCNGDCLQNFPIVDNGVIFVEDNVWLEGQIDGKKLTVAAYDEVIGERNIFLFTDLTYTNYDGSDVLGVMAQNDIEITRNSSDTLQLDGAFLAKEGRMGKRNYGIAKNSIRVYGSIASNGRINFGYTNGTGYQTRQLYFDNNLIYYPPPYFPTGSEILVDLWEEL